MLLGPGIFSGACAVSFQGVGPAASTRHPLGPDVNAGVATTGEGERMVDPSTIGVGMPSLWR